MAMIQHTTFHLKTLKCYPRPNHFKRRIDSLYGRFNNVVNVFPPSFHKENNRKNIDYEVKVFTKPLNITVVSNTDVELKELVISTIEEYTTHNAVRSAELYSGENGISIFVCYIKVGDTSSHGKETVRMVIDYFNANVRDARYEDDIFNSLFICCEVTLPDSNMDAFRTFINSCLNQTPATWDGEDRIIIGPDSVLLRSNIAKQLENSGVDILTLIYEYLDLFVCKNKSNNEIGDVAHDKIVQNTLYNFVRDGRSLVDVRQIISRDVDEGNTDEYDDTFLETLANRMKCTVLHPLAQKLGLNLNICNICLEEIHIVKILKKHISKHSKSQIRKLKKFTEKFEKKLQKSNESTEQSEDNRPTSTSIKFVDKCNDHMVHGIQNDISAALSEVETELKKAVKHISEVEKMQFEIKGYFKLAGIEMKYEKPYILPPEPMKRELFGINGVIGAGTVYGQFEVHVRGNDPRVKKDVSEVLKRHKFSQYSKVRKVEKEAVKLANIQHENGCVIKSKFPGQQRYREGTLGAFSEEIIPNSQDTQLYALTCAHVVSPCSQAQHDVFVIGRGGQLQKLGVSTPQLTIESGMIENANLIDFAAVKVEPTLQRHCVRYMKGEDGLPRKAYLSSMSLEQLTTQIVYKCGAKSFCTNGLVCSTDYIQQVNGMMGTDYVLLIDSLPGSDVDFALPGDSGSVVCMVDPKDDGSVAMVAMVQSGEFKLEGSVSSLCMCFQLSRALEALKQKTGIQLSV